MDEGEVAAVRLQATRRGQLGRRVVSGQQLELRLLREEAEEDAAAVRMQAARRGQQGRRSTKVRQAQRIYGSGSDSALADETGGFLLEPTYV